MEWRLKVDQMHIDGKHGKRIEEWVEVGILKSKIAPFVVVSFPHVFSKKFKTSGFKLNTPLENSKNYPLETVKMQHLQVKPGGNTKQF